MGKADLHIHTSYGDGMAEIGELLDFAEGSDLTVVTYLRGVTLVEAVADDLKKNGVEVDAIDLRVDSEDSRPSDEVE